MAVKGKGGGKTPERVVELVHTALSKKCLGAVSRESGLAVSSLRRYSQGLGEPSGSSLHKLADYFGVTVEWLQEKSCEGSKFNVIALFLLEENRRTIPDRDGDLYLDDFVELLTSFYGLPAHKRDFARALLEKSQRWFELHACQKPKS